MARSRQCDAALAVCLLVVGLPIAAAQAQLAVVVNRANPISGLTIEQLRRLYLGTSTTFPGGGSVTLVESPATRAEFYRALLGMTEDEVKRHWLGIVFGGEGASPPKEIEAVRELRRFVGEHAGGLAFLALADVDPSVKVVALGGVKPSDANYPLRGVGRHQDPSLLRFLDSLETQLVPVTGDVPHTGKP